MAETQQLKKEEKPVVWTSMFVPKEILFAMDVPVMYLEVFGGQASMLQIAGEYSQVMEEMGLSRDTCSVQRCSLGIACADRRDLLLELAFATPDLLVASNYPCGQEGKAFQLVVERYNCPYYFIDAPVNVWGDEVPDYAAGYLAGQYEGMIHFLERHRYRLNWTRLQEEVAFTRAHSEMLEVSG